MQQWEFFYLQAMTNHMDRVQEEATKLGALGWEPCGIASADKTIGVNANVLIFKRPIENVPPPPGDTAEHWQDDPTGRFEKRRWDPSMQVWTAETANVSTKERHVDAPRMS